MAPGILDPASQAFANQLLQEPAIPLPSKASTKRITRALGTSLPNATVDTIVRIYAKAKLDAWVGRRVSAPVTRLQHKADKLASSINAVAPHHALTSDAARAKLAQAVNELVPAPVSDLPALQLMDTCLGDDPHWQALQHTRALSLAASGARGFEDISEDTPQKEVLARYRDYCVQQYTPRLDANAVDDVATPTSDATLETTFSQGIARAIRVWAQVDRNKPLDVQRLRKMLKDGQEGTLSHFDRIAISRAAETAPVSFMQAYHLRKQVSAAHYKTTTYQAADSFWFFFGRDPLTADKAQLKIMQRHMLGLTAALTSVPGLEELMPPVTMLQLEEKILDVQNPQNVDRWTWVQEKLRGVLRVLPLRIVEQGGFGKLCWTMMGTAAGRAPWMPAGLTGEALDAETFRSLQAGLYFGMSYPFIDDVLDNPDAAKTLGIDARQSCEQLEEMLWRGTFDAEAFPKVLALQDLIEAFNGLKALLGDDAAPVFRGLALMLRAQRYDAEAMRNASEQTGASPGYVTALVKNFETSRATAKLFGAPDDHGENVELWSMFAQMLDDFIDVHEDAVTGNETVFTQFMKKPEGENPLTSMMHLALELDALHQGSSARLFLGRRLVRALRRIATLEDGKVIDGMLKTMAPAGELGQMLMAIAKDKASLMDIDRRTVDKLKAASAQWSASGRDIRVYMSEHKPQVDALMRVKLEAQADPTTLPLAAGKSYVMSAGGKRLRPLLVMMVADGLGLERNHVGALSRAVEQLHSTSLVFDDLPAQDNADTRRGKLTTHTPSGSALVNKLASEQLSGVDEALYGVPRPQAEARAQLTGLSLVGEAVQGVGELARHFPADRTLAVIQYMGACVQRLSDGQMMDLLTPGRRAEDVDVAYLERMAELKTGEAFDLSIRPVGILAGRPEADLRIMTQLANRLGVLYQVKDDILDVEGDAADTGKQVGIDARNGNKTFVTVLGIDGARDVLKRVFSEVTGLLDTLEGKGMRVSLLRELQTLIMTRKC